MGSRHKGIPTAATLDSKLPHQAAIPEVECCGDNFQKARARADELGSDLASNTRGQSFSIVIYRFDNEPAARTFAAEFSGEYYNANDRGKGTGWDKYRKNKTVPTSKMR